MKSSRSETKLENRFKHIKLVTQEKTKIKRGFFKVHLELIKNIPRINGPTKFSKKNDPVYGINFSNAEKTLKKGSRRSFYEPIGKLAPSLAEFSHENFLWFFLGAFIGDGCVYWLNCRGSLGMKGSLSEILDLFYYGQRFGSGVVKPHKSNFFLEEHGEAIEFVTGKKADSYLNLTKPRSTYGMWGATSQVAWERFFSWCHERVFAGTKFNRIQTAFNRRIAQKIKMKKPYGLKDLKSGDTSCLSQTPMFSGIWTTDGSWSFGFCSKKGKEKGIAINLCLSQPTDVNLLRSVQKEFGVGGVGKQNYIVQQKDLKVFFDYFDQFPPGGTKYFQYVLVRYMYFLVFQTGYQNTAQGKYVFWQTFKAVTYIRSPADLAEKKIQQKLDLHPWIKLWEKNVEPFKVTQNASKSSFNLSDSGSKVSLNQHDIQNQQKTDLKQASEARKKNAVDLLVGLNPEKQKPYP